MFCGFKYFNLLYEKLMFDFAKFHAGTDQMLDKYFPTVSAVCVCVGVCARVCGSGAGV